MPHVLKSRSLSTLLAVAAVALAWTSVNACINVFGINVHGKRVHLSHHEPGSYGRKLIGEHAHDHLRREQDRLKTLLSIRNDSEVKNDLAVTHMILGDPHTAIELLLQIESTHAGRYTTATNLGTAYELAGDNEKALAWIKEGIRRNEQSHLRTEWLHVQILEAKTALAQDPAWLEKRSVLGLDFGDDAEPRLNQADLKRMPKDIIEALEYQLHERTAFVKKPDPIVADLLSDLAFLHPEFGTVDEAKEVLELARMYGPPRKEVFERRAEWVEEFLANHAHISRRIDPVKTMLTGFAAFVCFVGAGIFVYVYFRRRHERRQRKLLEERVVKID